VIYLAFDSLARRFSKNAPARESTMDIPAAQ
jgi:hypothetical protein